MEVGDIVHENGLYRVAIKKTSTSRSEMLDALLHGGNMSIDTGIASAVREAANAR